MNITPLTIYLWQITDKIITSSFVFAVILGLAVLFSVIFYCVSKSDGDDGAAELLIFKASIMPFILSLAMTVLLPSSKTIAMMVVIPKIAESKVIQQDLPDIYNAAIKSLKEQLAEKQ